MPFVVPVPGPVVWDDSQRRSTANTMLPKSVCAKSHLRPQEQATDAAALSSTCSAMRKGTDMFDVRSSHGQITAAYLDEQFPGQEWLPIDSRSLQLFLVAA